MCVWASRCECSSSQTTQQTFLYICMFCISDSLGEKKKDEKDFESREEEIHFPFARLDVLMYLRNREICEAWKRRKKYIRATAIQRKSRWRQDEDRFVCWRKSTLFMQIISIDVSFTCLTLSALRVSLFCELLLRLRRIYIVSYSNPFSILKEKKHTRDVH